MVNESAIKRCIEFVENLIEFIKKDMKHFLRCSSILIILDNIKNEMVVKWIDFAHYGELKSGLQDENILVGLEEFKKILNDCTSNWVNVNMEELEKALKDLDSKKAKPT